MENMPSFAQEFKSLKYVLEKSDCVLLFPHTKPDGDAVGSVLALKEYIETIGKKAEVACFDPFPEYLAPIIRDEFLDANNINLEKYKTIIACDSVQRGFDKIHPQIGENQVLVLIDHHQDISLEGDIKIVDPSFSSVCEMIYDFFQCNQIEINKKIATCLLIGLLYDTGKFQHQNTTSKVLETASQLIKKGADINKITKTLFSEKSLGTLRLWGKAFERAKINEKNGLISSFITQKELEESGASNNDISYIAGMLNMVPGTKFALVISERENGILKGSFRSDENKNVDVSLIAKQFGGGGHRLASGFEIEGKIVEKDDGWEII